MSTASEEIYYDGETAPINRTDFAVGYHRGKVYVYGGLCAALGHGLADLHEYCPATATWKELTKKASPGRLIGAKFVSTGDDLLLFGGEIFEKVCECPLWRLCSPEDGRFEKILTRGAFPSNRKDSSIIFAETWTQEAAVFLFGGQRHLIGETDEFWKFSPKLQKWTKLPSGPSARSEVGLVFYQQNILVIGGYQVSDIWGYHTSIGVWTQWMKNIPKCISENVVLRDDLVYSVSNCKLGSFLYVIDLQERKYSFTTHSVEKATGSKMVAIGKPASTLRSRSVPGSRRSHKKHAAGNAQKKNLSKVGILNSGFDDDAPCSETVSAGISLNDLRSQERSSDSISYNSFEDFLSCSKLANRKSPESVDSAYSSSPEPYRSSSLLDKQSSPVLPFSSNFKNEQADESDFHLLIFGGKPLHPVYTRKPLYAAKINITSDFLP